jgi:hypothetical protein
VKGIGSSYSQQHVQGWAERATTRAPASYNGVMVREAVPSIVRPYHAFWKQEGAIALSKYAKISTIHLHRRFDGIRIAVEHVLQAMMHSGEDSFGFDRGITIAALWMTTHGLSHAYQRFANEVIQASEPAANEGVCLRRRPSRLTPTWCWCDS